MIASRPSVALLAASLLLTGCGSGAAAISDPRPEAAPTADAAAPTPPPSPAISVQAAPRQLPGLGPKTLARVPPRTRQVVMATGRGRDSSRSTVVLYERTAAGWKGGEEWPAHNARQGWTHHHRAEDLRSPVGVYDLTDAGGLLPDPGTLLPYDHDDGFTATGTGFEGEDLSGAFDYVIAVDYNREPGTSPLDLTRPLGAERGGGIWLHVDHDGPTQGCVSVARKHMKELLLTLDPRLHPVVVMGDAESLAR